MALTESFKQIEPFVGKMQRAPHAAHLSWMQRFQERVQTLIVTELGQDCPAMIVSPLWWPPYRPRTRPTAPSPAAR